MLLETLPYLVVFLIIIYSIFKDTNWDNNLAFLFLFLLSALRYDVGFDYPSYHYVITDGQDYNILRYAIGEQLFISLARHTFPQMFFIVNSFITIIFMKLAIERLSPNIAVSALAFYCFPNMFLYSLGVVRYFTAISILFYGSTFLREKRIYYFLGFQILALLFHDGAIIGLLLIPLYYFRISKMANIIILLFGFLGGEFILGEILSRIFPENIYWDQLVEYTTREAGSGMSKVPYFFLALDLIFLLGFPNLLRSSSKFYKYFTIYNVGVTLMFLFSYQNTLSIRLSVPFLIYSILLTAIIIQEGRSIYISRSIKLLVFEIMCLAIMLYDITIFNVSLGRSQYLPYQFFFNV